MAGMVVTGPVVVLSSEKSERYLYRGAAFDSGNFDAESVKHAKALGLIATAPKAEDPEAPAPSKK